MQVIVTPEHESLSRLAADIMVSELTQRQSPLFACIAGRTPKRAYELFVQRVVAETLPHHHLRHVQVNEWNGLGIRDAGSFASYLQENLLGPLEIPAVRRIAFDGDVPDSYAECKRVQEALTAQGPVDLMILGLGVNGHLAFNEPGSMLTPNAHLADLARATVDIFKPNSVRFDSNKGMTLGMADIMAARRVVILISGAHKATQVSRLMNRDISTAFPASMLWMHPQAVCIVDEAAFSRSR